VTESLEAPTRRSLELTGSGLAWGIAALVFVAMRLAALVNLPVGGAELDGLAGAWQLHAGNADERITGTLFQGIAAWLFQFTTSESAPRVLALLASASIPFALFRLRPSFGEIPLLVALLLLAFDAPAIVFGSTASSAGFDIALSAWLLVLVFEPKAPAWAFGVAGLLAVTAGPVVVPLILAVALVALLHSEAPPRDALIALAGGAVAGVLAASAGYGLGWQGFSIPLIDAFARGFEANLSTESTGYLTGLYVWPLLAAGLIAASWTLYDSWAESEWPRETLLLLVWAGLAVIWLFASAGENDTAPLAALALPVVLLLGRVVPGFAAGVANAEWRIAGPALALGLTAAVIIFAFVIDWARLDRVGSDRDKLIVAGLSLAVLASAGLVASSRRSLPTLFLPVAMLAALPFLGNAFAMAFPGPNEPLPSPISTIQGEELRDIALAAREAEGGLIVVHPDFERQMTWPLRDSGEVIVASRVPADARILLWPTTEVAPEGYSVLEGSWSFEGIRRGPSGGFLDYLRWFSDRNSLQNSSLPIAVYLRTGP